MDEDKVTYQEAVEAKEKLLKYLRSPEWSSAEELGEQEALWILLNNCSSLM